MSLWTGASGIFLSLWGIYVSPRSPGWVDFIRHVCVCGFVALLSVSFLFVAFWRLPSFLGFTISWLALCVLLCCCKHARCFLLLFFLSCGLREGRNALMAAGTGIAVFGHVENLFQNFKGLLDSMTCNLKAKSLSLHIPLLQRYIEAIQWLHDLAHPLSLLDDLVSWKQTLVVSLFSPSEAVRAQLNDTRGEVLQAIYQTMTTAEALSALSRSLFAAAGLVLILFGTGLFMKRFLGPRGSKFENIYITRPFVRFDESRRLHQQPCVFPLSKTERETYVVIPTFRPTPKERRRLGLFLLPVLSHLYLWVLFAAVDYLLYRLIFSVSKHFRSLPELQVHLKLHTEVEGLRRTINASAFHISLFEPSCIPEPKFLLSQTWVLLIIILVTLVLLGLLSSILMQLKILVATSFYPSVERERIQYLHAKLLKKRSEQLPGAVQRKLSLYLTKIHFWLPVLERMKKKQTDAVCEDNP
ncbi:dendritic cell-specific transmembrane protein [Echinops telfairi]|uniref:Dendritic cell-specific transmembrane protein n=1 Tax=Echinops telfairi TaxID=9371 RepID=A0ABM0IDR9_ECHTE|nr:dendritic cell-specific transmembrane protein [Echinops telfairi]